MTVRIFMAIIHYSRSRDPPMIAVPLTVRIFMAIIHYSRSRDPQ